MEALAKGKSLLRKRGQGREGSQKIKETTTHTVQCALQENKSIKHNNGQVANTHKHRHTQTHARTHAHTHTRLDSVSSATFKTNSKTFGCLTFAEMLYSYGIKA